jgi:hypothetical protein
MKATWFLFLWSLGGLAALAMLSIDPLWNRTTAQVQQSRPASPRVLLANTYNAVTRIHFTNVAIHKGSPNRNLAARRFQADVKYWLMDAKYYDRGELSIGNPELVEFVR